MRGEEVAGIEDEAATLAAAGTIGHRLSHQTIHESDLIKTHKRISISITKK